MQTTEFKFSLIKCPSDSATSEEATLVWFTFSGAARSMTAGQVITGTGSSGQKRDTINQDKRLETGRSEQLTGTGRSEQLTGIGDLELVTGTGKSRHKTGTFNPGQETGT
jgi:hypothetical protein